MRVFSINQKNPVQFLVCGNLRSSDEFLHMKRTIDENVLIIVQKGTLFINANRKSFEIGENQFVLLKAGEEHFGYKKSNGELSYLWLHFKTENFESYEIQKLSDCNKISGSSYHFCEAGTLLSSNRIFLLFRQLMDFSLDSGFYNKEVLDYLSSVILMEITNQGISEQKNDRNINPIVFEICSWIKSNYSHQFSIEDLSKINGYKSEYLSNLFKKNMGITIFQYTNQIRIETAKKLLPNFTIKETAFSCGFEDEKYFMKVFKKLEGLTPTEYKNTFFKKYVNEN